LSCVQFKAHGKHWAYGNLCLCRASNTTPTANLSFAVRHTRAARQRGLHVNGAQLDRTPHDGRQVCRAAPPCERQRWPVVPCAPDTAHGEGASRARHVRTIDGRPPRGNGWRTGALTWCVFAVRLLLAHGAPGRWRTTDIYVCRASPAGSRQSYNFFDFYTSFYFSTTKILLCTLYSNLIHFSICLLYLTIFYHLKNFFRRSGF
jgi:hypothetical protein